MKVDVVEDATIKEKIISVLATAKEGMAQRDIQELIGAKWPASVYQALKQLVDDGVVIKEQIGKKRRYVYKINNQLRVDTTEEFRL